MRIPEGWHRAPLGDVCRVVSGATPSTSVPSYWGGGVKWVTPNDMSKDRSQYIDGGERCLTADGFASCSAQVFPEGSVIVSSRAPIGYVAIAADEMCTNQGCKTAVPPPYIDSRYLYWFLLNARSDLEARASGTTFKEISAKRFAETQLWWPSPAEQRRIVAILEEHLSDLDDAGSALVTAEKRLSVLRGSRVAGHLTGNRRPKVESELPPVGTHDGVLQPLPVGWSWARLGAVAEVVGGVTKDSKKQADPSLPEVPYLRVANVQRGRLDLRSVTTIRVPETKARALALQAGDILLNEGGDRDKLARGWVWEGQIEQCIHQNHVFRARVTDARLDPYFLSMTANSFGAKWAERNGKQSVNLASISLSMIKKMPVIVPAPGEAQAAVKAVRAESQAFDRLESEIGRATARSAALRRAILAAAFSGRLTGHSSDTDVIAELAEEESA